jgi:mitochondrial fission protein ELM1
VLGARIEERAFRYHGAELLVHLWPGPSLAGVAAGGRPALAPPWPDLVIGAGRRSEPVARWIRRASGGRTRLVHLGRPWSSPSLFDLVVASSQYAVPAASNVLEFALPLAEPAPAPAGTGHEALFAHLPRPWTGVLLGGDSGFLLFDAERAGRLAAQLHASRAITGGSLIVTGSPRTPPPFLDALAAALGQPCFLHRWSAGAPNPYPAILATADALVVTSDSVSMVVEALATGKPVYLHDVRPRGHGWWRHPGEYRWRALSHRLVQAVAPRRFRRDVRRVHERLVADGAVRWLEGGAVPFLPTPVDVTTNLETVVRRIGQLLASRAQDTLHGSNG